MTRKIVVAAAQLVSAALLAAPLSAQTFDPARLARHVRTLSSDAFEGRAPATPGETRTVDYIIREFRAAGLQPGGDLKDGKRQWTQTVPLLKSDMAGAPRLLLRTAAGVEPLTQGTPDWEVAAVDRYYPFFEGLLRLLLRPSDKRAADALSAIRGVLDRVDARLADGRRYLNGDRFSLSDMAFAVAAAPIAWPENYGGAVPPLHVTPPELQSVIAETRARPSGAFALRIYADHR